MANLSATRKVPHRVALGPHACHPKYAPLWRDIFAAVTPTQAFGRQRFRVGRTGPPGIIGGPYGPSANFDGSVDFLRLLGARSLPLDSRGLLTITTLFRSDTDTAAGTIIGREDSGENDLLFFRVNSGNVLNDAGKTVIEFSVSTSLRYKVFSTNDILTNGAWQILTWAIDKAGQLHTLVLDGIVQSSTIAESNTSIAFGAWAGDPYIGVRNRNGTPESFLDGAIALVVIHLRYLPVQEIQLIHSDPWGMFRVIPVPALRVIVPGLSLPWRRPASHNTLLRM